MNKLFLSFFACVLLSLSSSCSRDTIRMTVASRQGDCVGVAPQKCLLVKEGNDPEWEFFYSSIEGFNYEPGYEYVLEVKKENRENPAADQSSIRYILVKEISKIQKESDNLP